MHILGDNHNKMNVGPESSNATINNSRGSGRVTYGLLANIHIRTFKYIFIYNNICSYNGPTMIVGKRNCTIDLVFVVDRSATMHNEWALVKQFLLEMIDAVMISNINVKVGIVSYNKKAKVECYLSGNEASIDSCITGNYVI